MEEILRAIVLGIIQGLTEFLPISSSGHLIAARELFDWQFADDLTFDVALHLGTTVAVIAFFWREWMVMIRSALIRLMSGRGPAASRLSEEDRINSRIFWLIAAGSVPVVLVGVGLQSYIEDNVRSPLVVGAMLIVFGVVLLIAEARGRQERAMDSTTLFDALFVGCAQALSLIPGVSRSGITISAGLTRGYTRSEAARLSFLLSTPAILGAGLLKMSDLASEGASSSEGAAIVAGAIVAAIVGWLSIGFLMRMVQSNSFLPFVIYRVIAGAFLLIYFSF